MEEFNWGNFYGEEFLWGKSQHVHLYIKRYNEHNLANQSSISRQTYSSENTAVKLNIMCPLNSSQP